MRRPRRWRDAALMGVTIASLLCLALSLLFGGRSFTRAESVLHEHGGPDGRSLRGVRSGGGVFTYFSVTVEGRVTTIYGDGWHVTSAAPAGGSVPIPSILGFRLAVSDSAGAGGSTMRSVQIGVPFWFVTLLASVAPACQAIAWRRARRAERPGFEVVALPPV